MGIQYPFSENNDSALLVDKVMGNAYTVVRGVYGKLAELTYIADNSAGILEAGNASLNAVTVVTEGLAQNEVDLAEMGQLKIDLTSLGNAVALQAGSVAEIATAFGDVASAVTTATDQAELAVSSAESSEVSHQAVIVLSDQVAEAKVSSELAAVQAVAATNARLSTAAALADATIAVGQSFTAPLVDGSLQAYIKVSEVLATAIGLPFPTAAAVRALITPARTDFLLFGKNLLNRFVLTVGKYLTNTGATGDNAPLSYSDFIAVTPGTTYSYYRADGLRYVCYYDAGQAVVAGGAGAVSGGFTVPAGVYFVRVTIYQADVDVAQLEVGAAPTAYESFSYQLKLANGTPIAPDMSAVPAGAIPASKLAVKSIGPAQLTAGAITPLETNFLQLGKNKFNATTATIGSYVPATGVPAVNAAYDYSDFIPVVPGETYTANDPMRFTCYYDANHAVVAGGAGAGGVSVSTFTVPAGVYFVRVTLTHTALATFQLEHGAVATSFAAFGYLLQPADGAPVSLPGLASTAPEVVLPPAIYGVQGRECNVYFDNLHLADAADYLHDVTSALSTGAQQKERWTWTPAGAVVAGSLTVAVHDKRSGALLTSVTALQRAAAAAAGAGLTKKVLPIGDSLINAGDITQTLLDIAATDVMGITLLGTRGVGANKHEGRGGWSIANYTTNFSEPTYGANPFWISGSVNFPQYLINNSIVVPDWVTIHLGINDVFGQTTDAGASATADAAFVNLDILVASIKAAGAGVKVALMIPPPPSSSQDAFGASYGTNQTRWRFKRNILIWARQLIAKYAGQEANRIYLVPSNTSLDTVNNMSVTASLPVNSRSLISAARQNNGVHPATPGYQQNGDSLWAFFKYYA